MYKRILVAIENSPADNTILEHVEQLARLTGASLLLVHVADGWVARSFDQLNLRESAEILADRAYLAGLKDQLTARGFTVDTQLAMGDPATELVRITSSADVDLIAMATHGHRLIKDVLLGATVDKVRHQVRVPVLLLQSPPDREH
jgi:nucleotide-binding universal stress UspA family protein